MSATSAVPAPHLEGKNEKDISEVTAYFKLQNQPNACYPTCICNVLKALANMHQYPPIAFPEHQVNKLCGYRMDFGPNMSIVVPNMDKALRSHGYGAYTKIPTTYDALVKIVEDKESSYPVIEVSYKYLEDRTDLAEDEVGIGSPPDHMIIVLSCNPDQTIIFDPYDAHSKVMQTRPDRVGRGLYVISTGQLTEYWEKAFYGSWTFWVRRKTKETTKSTFLDQYSSTREVK